MDTEKLIVRFREDIEELNRQALHYLAPNNKDFFKIVGKIEMLEGFVSQISDGEWDEEE